MNLWRYLAVLLSGLLTMNVLAEPAPGPGLNGYESLVRLFEAFDAWQNPGTTEFDDYGPAAIALKRAQLGYFQSQLDALDVTDWPRAQKIDFLAVRSRLDQALFRLEVSRPWARDPGFYLDRVLRVAFVDLPVADDRLDEVRVRFEAVPGWLDQARNNLREVATDYADLALHNLTRADGVGHGHPYRETPPAGIIGWYEDALARTPAQPALEPAIRSALDAVRSFHAWLVDRRPEMTAAAGVGAAHFDWYLRQVKLMPYSTDDIVTLGQRELDRLWSLYALERHRNRDLPELDIATSAADYQQRIRETDRHVRAFLETEDVLSIPADIGELDTNAPWIERPGGPNFWEQVQYRDPHPDHLHAVIPGHRFDRLMAQRVDHPIRSRLYSGARAEGWGVYVEEAMLQAGLFEALPRVRELIYVFGIFRAARVSADVWLQLNRMTVDEVVEYWLQRVPLLDRNVARVDAEIYLRRPPGYGLGYTIGMLQMQRLLADRKRQLGEDFDLRAFHDEFLGKGWMPISLIRWEMTGLDDEISLLWDRQPLP